MSDCAPLSREPAQMPNVSASCRNPFSLCEPLFIVTAEHLRLTNSPEGRASKGMEGLKAPNFCSMVMGFRCSRT